MGQLLRSFAIPFAVSQCKFRMHNSRSLYFLVDDEVGPITVLHTEPLIDPNDLTMIPIALSLHFIDEDSLVVTFTAMSGIR